MVKKSRPGIHAAKFLHSDCSSGAPDGLLSCDILTRQGTFFLGGQVGIDSPSVSKISAVRTTPDREYDWYVDLPRELYREEAKKNVPSMRADC